MPEGVDPADKEQLWRALNSDLKRKQCVPVEVTLDGEAMEPDVFLSATGGQELSVKTRNVRELIQDSLASSKAYLEPLQKGFDEIADHFEAEEQEEGLKKLQQATEGVSWVLQVLENTQKLLGIDDSEVLDGEFAPTRKKLAAVLQEAVPALEEGKFFELSFRLREEVKPSIGHLGPYIDALMEMSSGKVQ